MERHLYLAPENYFSELESEVRNHADLKPLFRHGNALIVEGNYRDMAFAENSWKNCQLAEAPSIQKLAHCLKSQGKNWVSYKAAFNRRMSLIEENIHRYSLPDLQFPNSYQLLKPSAWTLLEENRILYSLETDSVFPLGRPSFIETKRAPSRAYLKLWDFFIRTGKYPKAGEHCLDMGSSPGGWTWVLDQLKCQITSVDRAPLTDELRSKPHITNLIKDAFALKPSEIKPIDWFFSDLICYPEKLLDLIYFWREHSKVKNFVCTIKFQGPTDFEILKKFRAISGSHIVHLSVNKHEVTWFLLD